MHATLPLGHIVATPAALEAIQESGQTMTAFLDRLFSGYQGGLCRQANGNALGPRLLSASRTRNGCWVWVLTEGDRSVTKILLPSEFRRQEAASQFRKRVRSRTSAALWRAK